MRSPFEHFSKTVPGADPGIGVACGAGTSSDTRAQLAAGYVLGNALKPSGIELAMP